MKLIGIGHFLIQGPFVFIAARLFAIASGLVASGDWVPWYSVLAALACWHFGATCVVVGHLLEREKRCSVPRT